MTTDKGISIKQNIIAKWSNLIRFVLVIKTCSLDKLESIISKRSKLFSLKTQIYFSSLIFWCFLIFHLHKFDNPKNQIAFVAFYCSYLLFLDELGRILSSLNCLLFPKIRCVNSTFINIGTSEGKCNFVSEDILNEPEYKNSDRQWYSPTGNSDHYFRLSKFYK